jgi:uncharacterized protein YxjI
MEEAVSRVITFLVLGLFLASCMVKNKEIETGLSNKKMTVTDEIKGVFTPVASMYGFLDKLNTVADVSDISGTGDSTVAVIKRNIFSFSQETQLVFDYLNTIELGDFTVEGNTFRLIYNVNVGEFDDTLSLTPFKIQATGTLSGEVVTEMNVALTYELDGASYERVIFIIDGLHKEVIFEELMVGVTEIVQGMEFDIDALGGMASYLLTEHVLGEFVYVNFVPEVFALKIGLTDGNPYTYDVPDRPYTLQFDKLHLVFDESGINFEQSELEVQFINTDTKDTIDFNIDGVYLDGEKIVSWKELIQ